MFSLDVGHWHDTCSQLCLASEVVNQIKVPLLRPITGRLGQRRLIELHQPLQLIIVHIVGLGRTEVGRTVRPEFHQVTCMFLLLHQTLGYGLAFLGDLLVGLGCHCLELGWQPFHRVVANV